MKKFNKNKAIRKINLQQNKSTYIKRLSISLSCLFLLICVLLFTFAKFETSSDIYTLINGKVRYYEIGHIWNFDYTGNYQEFNVPHNGTYKIELWGAQGGGSTDYPGANGAYTKGDIHLNSNQKLYIYVGEHGDFVQGRNGGNSSFTFSNSIYNNGSKTIFQFYSEARRGYGYAGGGATDVRLVSGSWNSFDSLKSRIMVAAGGGGSNTYWEPMASDGAAGGLNGYNGSSINNNHYSSGATQISGGSYNGVKNGFGIATGSTGTASGGSGYYAGGPGAHASGVVGVGAGGSSFISGYLGCNAIAQSSTENNITHTGSANHYSGKVFTSGIMIDGKGCNWSTGAATNCGNNQVQPSGSNTAGHTGHGYARITLLSKN